VTKPKRQPHQRIRNPFVPALIKRRPNTRHKDKTKESVRPKFDEEFEG